MRKCPNCESEAGDGVKFCSVCGFLFSAYSRTCANGHPLDPKWKSEECPVCATVAARAAHGERVPPLPVPAQLPSPPNRPSTVFFGDESSPRRIAGLLITYTWKPEGQVFPLREGRNIIGRDPNESDIVIPQDVALSTKNTLITYRKHFVIADAMSMSGTDVEGQPVEEQMRLKNYATIRTGSTFWTFISIDPEIDAPV